MLKASFALSRGWYIEPRKLLGTVSGLLACNYSGEFRARTVENYVEGRLFLLVCLKGVKIHELWSGLLAYNCSGEFRAKILGSVSSLSAQFGVRKPWTL